MVSNTYYLKRNEKDFANIPEEAQRVAEYHNLDKRSVLRMRLLAEELICMLPHLLRYGKGKFWIENVGKRFELHLGVMIDKMIEETEKLRFHYELLEPLIMHDHSNNILQLLENLYDKSKD